MNKSGGEGKKRDDDYERGGQNKRVEERNGKLGKTMPGILYCYFKILSPTLLIYSFSFKKKKMKVFPIVQ